MARPFWSGQVQISLVSFGVKLFPAVEAKSEIRFHQINRRSGERVRHQKVSEGDEAPVQKEDIVKGYEYSKGEYIPIDPEEIANLRIPSRHTLELQQFVSLDELDPAFFEKPYFVTPENDAQAEAFAVVRKALAETRKAGLGKIALSGREHLMALSAPSGKDLPGLMAYTLRFAAELRSAREYFAGIGTPEINEESLDLAKELIRRKTAKFEPEKFTDQYEAALALPVESALIDGEVVVLEANGVSSFAELQTAFQENAKRPLTYFVFDLLHLDGHNLRNLPLRERKRILERVVEASGRAETIRLSEHIAGDGGAVFRKACELGTEGIVGKRADSRYCPGRGGSWLKIKCYREQELVIGGFTLPTNGFRGVGALLLGYYRSGKLIYAGKTGTGFTQKTHRAIRDRLEKLRTAARPFAEMPAGNGKVAIWVKPELAAQVSFSNWTADNLVRQASFKGLREDKPAKNVVREVAEMDPNPKAEPAPARTSKAKSAKSPAPAAKSRLGAARSKAGGPEDLPIPLTHPDKVIDAESGVTKQQLARYYLEVAPWMLPHIAGRPLTLVHCTEGSGKPCFYQKHLNQMPKGLDSVDVINRKTGAREPYITLSTPEALVELAQIGVLEVHPWGSRNETMEQPDRIVIDLDPDPAIDWQIVASSAKEVRKRLKKLGLESFVKTTGGKGLHVVVPIRPEHEWSAVKQFAHEFVLAMERDNPKLFLTKMTKAARAGKIYLDYLRNDRNATAVAPYSPRARSGLPIAMPLSWKELNAKARPRFRVGDIPQFRKRLARDPWKELLHIEQRLILP